MQPLFEGMKGLFMNSQVFSSNDNGQELLGRHGSNPILAFCLKRFSSSVVIIKADQRSQAQPTMR